MVLAAKILLVIASLGLIIVVLLQSGKSAGLSGAIGGGAEQLLGKQKARGIDALLGKLTVGFGVAFMVSAILLGYVLRGAA
jgi:preprotein translocase subunit SecG